MKRLLTILFVPAFYALWFRVKLPAAQPARAFRLSCRSVPELLPVPIRIRTGN